MFKRVLFLALVLAFANASNANAKDTTKVDSTVVKNQIKINLLPLVVFNTVELSYERLLKPRLTFGASIKRNITRTEPSLFNIGKFSEITYSGSRFGNFALTQQLKWYPKLSEQLAPHGLYLGAQLRYQNLSYRSTLSYEDIATTNIDVDLEANLYSFGFGIELGYQVRFENNLLLDFSFFGPRISQNIFIAKLNAEVNNEFLDELSNNVNEVIGLGIFDPGLSMSQTVAQTFIFGGFRYAISVGYSF
ncbi:MAG: DUF3575 domain-containing protein [Bacteroidia bacterium]